MSLRARLRARVHAWWVFSPGSLRRGTRNFGWLAAGAYVSYAISIVSFMVVARRLGPSQYGLLSAALAYTGLFGFLQLPGFGKVLTRDIARGAADADTLFRRLLGLNLLTGTFGAAAALIGLMFVTFASGTTSLIVILCVTLLVQPISSLMYSLFQGHQVMKWMAIVDLSRQSIYMAVVVPLVFVLPADQRVLGVAATLAGSYCCALGANLLIARRFIDRPLHAYLPRLPRPIVKTGLVFTSFTVFSYLFTKVDVLLASQFLGPRDVGLYAVALNISDRVRYPIALLGVVMLPLVASELKRGFDPSARSLRRAAAFFGLAGAAAAVVAWLISGPAIVFLFGRPYVGSQAPLKYLLLALAIGLAVLPVSIVLQASGREMVMLKALLIRAAVNVALDVLFLELGYGIVGVAWATVACTTIYAVLLFFLGARSFRSGKGGLTALVVEEVTDL